MTNEADYIGNPVQSLQQMLRRISFRDSTIPRVAPTGEYDDRTVKAVKTFQQTRGLAPTGETDEETWNTIADEFRNVKRSEEIVHWPVFGDWRLAVEPGEFHPILYPTQAMFSGLREHFTETPPVEITGRNDEKTTHAIKWLQNRAGRDEDGIFDKFVWELLTGVYYMYLTRRLDYLPRPYSDASFSKED